MAKSLRLRHAAFAAVLGVLFSSAWFIRVDTEPPSFDESWYLETSCRFFTALTRRGLPEFAAEYAHSFRFKAPLIALVPLPAYAVSGISEDAAFYANLASLPVTALFLFLLGKRLFSEEIASIALIIWITTPLTFGLSRRFFVENWLTAFAVAAVYHLCASRSMRDSRHSLLAGVHTGLGLLTKSIFPLYLIGPMMLTLRERLVPVDKRTWGEVFEDARPFLWASTLIALTWYAFNWMTTAVFMIRGGYGDIGAHYGNGPAWYPSNLLRFSKIIIAGCTSEYYAAALAIFGAYQLWRRRGGRANDGAQDLSGPKICALWIAVPLGFILLGAATEVRYFNPCMPPFALLCAWALWRSIEASPRRSPALLLFFLYPAAAFWAQTAPASPAILTAVAPRETAWSGPPRRTGRFGQEAFVEALASEIGETAVVAMGLEQRYFNANRLAALAACGGHDLKFVNYGHMESRVERIVARLSQKDVDYLLLVEGMETPGLPAEAISGREGFAALQRAGALPFSERKRFPLENGAIVRLLKRTGPIRMTGARTTALPDAGKLK